MGLVITTVKTSGEAPHQTEPFHIGDRQLETDHTKHHTAARDIHQTALVVSSSVGPGRKVRSVTKNGAWRTLSLRVLCSVARRRAPPGGVSPPGLRCLVLPHERGRDSPRGLPRPHAVAHRRGGMVVKLKSALLQGASTWAAE